MTSRQAVAALRFTLLVSLVTAAINAVTGTLIAWVLVRDRFRGKALVNALIDLPFALPTIVAGLTLLALYGPTSPLGINVAFTQLAVAAGAAVRDAAVRRPLGAAGADRARPRDGGGGGVAGRRAAARCSAASSCRTSCRRSSSGAALALRARARRVRLGGADLGQPPVQDARSPRSTSSGRSRATTRRRRRGVGRAARALAAWCCSAIRGVAGARAMTVEPRLAARAAHVALGYLALLLLVAGRR